MALNFDHAFGVHAQALRVRAERTQLLASNLANANTPGYQARDLDFAATMARTSEAHSLGGTSAALEQAWADGDADTLYRVPNLPSRDGNTVEVGVEQALFSQNTSDFQMSMTFLNMKLRGLQSAIRGE